MVMNREKIMKLRKALTNIEDSSSPQTQIPIQGITDLANR